MLGPICAATISWTGLGMTADATETEPESSYAMSIADSSYRWYVSASKRSRRAFRLAELGAVVLSASIPLAAVLTPDLPQITAVLGSVLVVIAGARAIFHWQENYLRFSQAREAVEEQRRLYRVMAPPYDRIDGRDVELVRAVTRIENEEMGRWVQIAQVRAERRASLSE